MISGAGKPCRNVPGRLDRTDGRQQMLSEEFEERSEIRRIDELDGRELREWEVRSTNENPTEDGLSCYQESC